MLDVAAVAECLLAQGAHWSADVHQTLALLVALHDLGKIGEPFRAMLRDGTVQRHGRHWVASEVLLRHHDALLQFLSPGLKPSAERRARESLYAAVAGHHGVPPSLEGERAFAAVRQACGEQALQDSGALIRAFVALWPGASLADLSKVQLHALSWWLPGLTAAADWVGSNAEWFPPQAPDLPLPAYLDRARGLACVAVQRAGLNASAPSDAQLFDFAPRPMQAACAEIALPDGPTLAFIEDETGAGKTEAALLLAQRMMLAGKGRGIFFALPTMATANAMFSRAREIVARMFTSPPNLTLAHGRAPLSRDWRELREHRAAQEDTPGCTDWLADNRRRALLAQVGVGTIDQALLATLPTRYATLRHYGLSSKILIVDEVHEMGEAYMAEELKALLRAHRMAGGSAILLTATLPLGLRSALAQAFGAPAPEAPAYPALSIAGGADCHDFALPQRGRGPVRVRRLPNADAALARLIEKAKQGAACVWVRNAVDDAIAAVQDLRARGIEADLLHARFALCDRLKHEQAALDRFGKDGKGRAGRVLVGTQVLESSLDLDFDVMVSDLAPMAALIQRAGRLWRHMALRPAQGRPVPAPVLHVVSPDPDEVADPRWLHAVLDKGAYVYPLDVQWRTARVLFDAGAINAPAGLRALIEAVHGEGELVAVPAPFQSAEIKNLGKERAAAHHALSNVIDWDKGYRQSLGLPDVDYPTRIGPEQRTLMLARWQDGQLQPWASVADDTTPAEREALSEVRASKARLQGVDLPSQDTEAVRALTQDWPDWKKSAVTVCPVADDGTIGVGLRYDPTRGLLFE
jgi:CRISPR-associated endonuclease/helicase Cas3